MRNLRSFAVFAPQDDGVGEPTNVLLRFEGARRAPLPGGAPPRRRVELPHSSAVRAGVQNVAGVDRQRGRVRRQSAVDRLPLLKRALAQPALR